MSGDLGSRGSVSNTLQTALTPVVWGTTYIVATEFLPDGRPMLAALVRALPVGLAFVLVRRTLPQGIWWWRAAVLGTLNIGAFFALLFVAAFRLPGGVAATAGAIQPLVAAVIAAALLGETFARRTALAGVGGVVGVGMLVLGPSAALDPIGIGAAVAGTLSMATGVVLTKYWGRPVDLITFTGWQLTVGGTALAPIVLVVEGLPNSLSTTNLIGFVWLATAGTGLAYANWFRGIQQLPVAIVSFLGLLSPVVATVAGWVVLNERLSATQLVGGGVVLVAVIISQTSPSATQSRRFRRRTTSGQSAFVSLPPNAPTSRTFRLNARRSETSPDSTRSTYESSRPVVGCRCVRQ